MGKVTLDVNKIKKDVLKIVKKKVEKEGVEIDCPSCKKKIKVKGGENICPFCKKTIDLNVK